MIKLTRGGKIFLAVLLLLLIGGGYMLFKPKEQVQVQVPVDQQKIPLTSPVPNPPAGFSFPLKGHQIKGFEQQALAVRNAMDKNKMEFNYCTFFMPQMQVVRGYALDFRAIISKADDANQFEDTYKGRDLYPVYPIGSGKSGIVAATQASEGQIDAENPPWNSLIQGCPGAMITDPTGAPTDGVSPVVVWFPKGFHPQAYKGKVVRIMGYIKWGNTLLHSEVIKDNPNAPGAPLVDAGLTAVNQATEANDPATYERNLNIAVRQAGKNLVIRLGKLQFTNNAIRVWAQLINTGGTDLTDGWSGTSEAKIYIKGNSGKTLDLSGGGAQATEEQLDTTEDQLDPAQPVPAKQMVAGWLVFPNPGLSLQPSADLVLSFPSLNAATPDNPQYLINLPGRLNIPVNDQD